MMLRKRQSWTVTWYKPTIEQLTADPFHHGQVKLLNSVTGQVRDIQPGDTVLVDATLELTPLEGGWELLP